MTHIGHGFRAISKALAEWQGGIGGFVARLDKEDVPYLSFSKINAVESCQHRYFLEYVKGVELDRQPACFTKGTAFHDAASMAYQQISDGNADIERLLAWIKKHHGDHLVHLGNAARLLIDNAHQGYDLVATEHPFVLSLGPDLPPLIGVIDLLMRKGDTVLVVDHKTGKDLYEQDAIQLLIYSEYARRAFKPDQCIACFDEYRWVNDLARIRKPAFRRTHVRHTPRSWSSALRRVQRGFQTIRRIEKTGEARSSSECWSCPFKDVCDRAVVQWNSWW